MSDTHETFPTREAAFRDAEANGYDRDDVLVSIDDGSDRHSWELREYQEDGETPSNSVDGAMGAVIDVVAGLGDVVTGDDDAPMLTSYVSLPDLVALPAPIPMNSFIDPVTGEDVQVDDVDASVDALTGLTESDLAPIASAAPVADVPVAAAPAPVADVVPTSGGTGQAEDEVGDCVLQIHGTLPRDAAVQMARLFANRHMTVVTVRDAKSLRPVMTILPGVGKARDAETHVPKSGTSAGAPTPPAPRVHVETVLDRCKRGVWLDSEIPESNATILTLKHRIEEALRTSNVTVLRAIDFKSASTYYKQARAYLGHAIEHAEAAQKALAAEYGI